MKIGAFCVSILIALTVLSGCSVPSSATDRNENAAVILNSQDHIDDVQMHEDNTSEQVEPNGDDIAKELTQEDIDRIDKEETYPETPGQLETVYNDISSLIEDATHIAEVEVLEQDIVYLDGFPQTHTTVCVIESYKGDLDADAKLTVIEEGGNGGKVMGGIPQLSSESGYVLFLTEYNGNYYVCGAYQGRFIIIEGYVFQQATENVKMRAYAPIAIDEFRQRIKDQVSEIGK